MKWLDCQKVQFNRQLVFKVFHSFKKKEAKLKTPHLIQARDSKIIKNNKQKQKQKQTKNK